jgi:thymidylate synthase
MVNAWNVGEIDQMTLPPCHYGFQVYTRELSLDEKIDLLPEKKDWDDYDTLSFKEKIEKGPQRAISLMWNQRSVDTFLGLPFNIASYGLLLEIIAKLVNMVPDELIGNLGDTHLYSNHIEQTKEQIGREPHPLPTLNINTEWWPTESGESGIGPISTDGFLQGLDNNIQHFIRCLIDDDLQLVNYQSHSHIKAPLSN